MKRSPDRSALELAHAATDGLEAAVQRFLAVSSVESINSEPGRELLALLAERGLPMPGVVEEAVPRVSQCDDCGTILGQRSKVHFRYGETRPCGGSWK